MSHPRQPPDGLIGPAARKKDRIQRTLERARRETGIRDLLTFSLGRAWSVLLIFAAMIFVAAEKWKHPTVEESATNTGERDSDTEKR